MTKSGELIPDGFKSAGPDCRDHASLPAALRVLLESAGADFAQEELTTADWLRVFGEAGALRVLHLHLTGGEPLAHPDLVELIEGARQSRLNTNLITSGIGLSRERLAQLVEVGLDHIQLSFQDSSEGHCELDCRSARPRAQDRTGRLGKENGVLRVVAIDFIVRTRKGREVEITPKRNKCPGNCPANAPLKVFLGSHEVIDALPPSNQDTAELDSLARKLIQEEIDNDRKCNCALPIDVLRIDSRGTRWVGRSAFCAAKCAIKDQPTPRL